MLTVLALDRLRSDTLRRPSLDPGSAPAWRTPRIEIALVGGFFPKERPIEWTFVGRLGGPVLLLSHARLYGYCQAGYDAAIAAAVALQIKYCPTGIAFTARVVVTGGLDEPEDLIEAWRLEGSEPREVRYAFEEAQE